MKDIKPWAYKQHKWLMAASPMNLQERKAFALPNSHDRLFTDKQYYSVLVPANINAMVDAIERQGHNINADYLVY